MHSKFYQQTFPQICISPSQFLVSFRCLSYLELCIYVLPIITIKSIEGFPGGAVVENLPANAGDTGSSPGLGRSHMLRSN